MTLDRLHESADRKGNRYLISTASAMSVLFMWGFQERYWGKVVRPKTILSIRDGYADPAAYAPFYMGGSLGKMEIPQRISFLHLLHGSPYRDRTIYLDIDPVVAVRRIRQRMEQEQGASGLTRPPKWIHQHENEVGIRQIREEFMRVLSYLETNCGTRVSKIDAGDQVEVVGRRVAEAIKSKL